MPTKEERSSHRRIACLMTYINQLLELVDEKPATLREVTHEMLKKEFKNKLNLVNCEEPTDDDDEYVDVVE